MNTLNLASNPPSALDLSEYFVKVPPNALFCDSCLIDIMRIFRMMWSGRYSSMQPDTGENSDLVNLKTQLCKHSKLHLLATVRTDSIVAKVEVVEADDVWSARTRSASHYTIDLYQLSRDRVGCEQQ
jgi:hypothetical protein